jgi:hypothetical protein
MLANCTLFTQLSSLSEIVGVDKNQAEKFHVIISPGIHLDLKLDSLDATHR